MIYCWLNDGISSTALVQHHSNLGSASRGWWAVSRKVVVPLGGFFVSLTSRLGIDKIQTAKHISRDHGDTQTWDVCQHDKEGQNTHLE